jgi:hypothetical protein
MSEAIEINYIYLGSSFASISEGKVCRSREHKVELTRLLFRCRLDEDDVITFGRLRLMFWIGK